jgi:hypothetical protein
MAETDGAGQATDGAKAEAMGGGRLRFWAGLLAIAAAAALAGWAVRALLIEPPEPAWACQALDTAPWWCPLRLGFIAVLQAGTLGVAAAAAGLWALVCGGRWASGIAVALGGAGLLLYAAGPSALAVVLGLIRGARA